MITITNNAGGKEEVKLTVTKGSYEAYYKRLGYKVINDTKSSRVSTEKVDAPKAEIVVEKEEVSEEEKRPVRRKTISND